MAFEENNSSNNRTLDSEEDSEDGSRQEDFLAGNELPIVERLDPNSVDMTEEELETAFSRLTLAFRCDQFTLNQRVQAEEAARNRAEENLKLEVDQGQEMLEALKGMCLDIKRAKMVQRLELCLNIIRGTIERIARTAEVLGAVHQEAKVSRAVELMVAHVENLKLRQERDAGELDEMRKQVQKSNRARQALALREEVEAMQKTEKDAQQPPLRRRISAAIILRPEQRKQSMPSSPEEDGCTAAQMLSIQLKGTSEPRSEPENEHHTDQRSTFSLSLRSALERSAHWAKTTEHILKRCSRFARWLERPLLQWMCHFRWIIFAIYLLMLLSIITLAILVWILRAPVLWL